MEIRKHYPKASHRTHPKYAPRTSVCPAYSEAWRPSHSTSSDDACSDEFGRVRPAYTCTPRVLRGSSLLSIGCEGSRFFCSFTLFSLPFCIVLRARSTPKPRYHSRAPKQVPRSWSSREVRFPSRSSAWEKFDFCGDLPDLLRIITSISCSAVRSSSDQVSVWLLSSNA